MTRTLTLLSAVLLSSSVAAAVPSAFAQPTAVSPQHSSAVAVSDQQLKAFVDASVKVNAVTQQYLPKLQHAGDNTDQQKAVMTEANDKMVAVVKQSGLQIDEFKRISQAVKQDPQLLKRAQTMLPSEQHK